MAPDSEETEAIKRSTELLQAPLAGQEKRIAALRNADGQAATLALANAIAALKPAFQVKARNALALRLAGLDVKELAKNLEFDDPEIRRAVATALALKKNRDHLPDLLKTMEDSDLGVVQAVRASLKVLTGQDFGPVPGAQPIERFIAVGQW